MLVWTRRILAAALLASAAGVVVAPLFAADPPLKASLPDAPKQQDADMAYIKASLEKKARNTLDKTRASALFIALSAQNRMGKDEALAGLRDQMLKLAAALEDNDDHKADWKAAQAAFDGIKDAKGKTVDVKIDSKEFDTAGLMSVYKKKDKGGRGWEDALTEQAKKATDAELALEIAQGSLLVGQMADHFPGEKVKSAKDKAKWAELTAEMRKVSLDAATEAAKGKKADMKDLGKKLDAINANCNACHSAFKK